MNETAIMIGTLAAPLVTAWAVWRGFPGRLQAFALLPLVMFAINAALVLTDLGCARESADAAWNQCVLPGLATFSNALAPLYRLNLMAILALTPALLILAGIAAAIRREGHKN